MKRFSLLFMLSAWLFFLPTAAKAGFDRFLLNDGSSDRPIPVSPRGMAPATEPAVIPGDFADPSIVLVNGTYYATGTSSEWAPHFPLFTSTDLAHWKPAGFVLAKTPSWAASSFWAPELFYWKGTFYVYYVAKRKADGISCIGVATTTDPSKGFTDRGIVLEHGNEAIDPFIVEEKGQLYITWKAYGLASRPIELLGATLSADGLKAEGTPFMLLRDDEKRGLEGQCLVKRGDFYYLLYSLGACCGRKCSYQVEVARSNALQGPYVKFDKNPVLTDAGDWKCPGHGTLVETKEGATYLLYHAYSKKDHVYTGRQGLLGRVQWDPQTGWPSIQPVGETSPTGKQFRDAFSQPAVSASWQWDFRHTDPALKIQKGNLYLSGRVTSENQSGTALAVRALFGDYEMSTAVVNRNASLKGLVLYGDAAQSTGIGIKGDTIQVWEVNKQRKVLAREMVRKKGLPVYLKMTVKDGFQCRFFWSESGKDWTELKTGDAYYSGEFLPPWDRSPRPGLLHKGAVDAPAAFDFFEITYQ